MPGKVRGLLFWCKKVTNGYHGVEVVDMTSSWRNGLAFCALIHRFRPDLIDFDSLSAENVYENNKLAFSVAEKEFDIPSLLDPEDLVRMSAPDRYSVVTYVSQYYDYFKDMPFVTQTDTEKQEDDSGGRTVESQNSVDSGSVERQHVVEEQNSERGLRGRLSWSLKQAVASGNGQLTARDERPKHDAGGPIVRKAVSVSSEEESDLQNNRNRDSYNMPEQQSNLSDQLGASGGPSIGTEQVEVAPQERGENRQDKDVEVLSVTTDGDSTNVTTAVEETQSEVGKLHPDSLIAEGPSEESGTEIIGLDEDKPSSVTSDSVMEKDKADAEFESSDSEPAVAVRPVSPVQAVANDRREVESETSKGDSSEVIGTVTVTEGGVTQVDIPDSDGHETKASSSSSADLTSSVKQKPDNQEIDLSKQRVSDSNISQSDKQADSDVLLADDKKGRENYHIDNSSANIDKLDDNSPDGISSDLNIPENASSDLSIPEIDSSHSSVPSGDPNIPDTYSSLSIPEVESPGSDIPKVDSGNLLNVEVDTSNSTIPESTVQSSDTQIPGDSMHLTSEITVEASESSNVLDSREGDSANAACGSGGISEASPDDTDITAVSTATDTVTEEISGTGDGAQDSADAEKTGLLNETGKKLEEKVNPKESEDIEGEQDTAVEEGADIAEPSVVDVAKEAMGNVETRSSVTALVEEGGSDRPEVELEVQCTGESDVTGPGEASSHSTSVGDGMDSGKDGDVNIEADVKDDEQAAAVSVQVASSAPGNTELNVISKSETETISLDLQEAETSDHKPDATKAETENADLVSTEIIFLSPDHTLGHATEMALDSVIPDLPCVAIPVSCDADAVLQTDSDSDGDKKSPTANVEAIGETVMSSDLKTDKAGVEETGSQDESDTKREDEIQMELTTDQTAAVNTGVKDLSVDLTDGGIDRETAQPDETEPGRGVDSKVEETVSQDTVVEAEVDSVKTGEDTGDMAVEHGVGVTDSVELALEHETDDRKDAVGLDVNVEVSLQHDSGSEDSAAKQDGVEMALDHEAGGKDGSVEMALDHEAVGKDGTVAITLDHEAVGKDGTTEIALESETGGTDGTVEIALESETGGKDGTVEIALDHEAGGKDGTVEIALDHEAGGKDGTVEMALDHEAGGKDGTVEIALDHEAGGKDGTVEIALEPEAVCSGVVGEAADVGEDDSLSTAVIREIQSETDTEARENKDRKQEENQLPYDEGTAIQTKTNEQNTLITETPINVNLSGNENNGRGNRLEKEAEEECSEEKIVCEEETNPVEIAEVLMVPVTQAAVSCTVDSVEEETVNMQFNIAPDSEADLGESTPELPDSEPPALPAVGPPDLINTNSVDHPFDSPISADHQPDSPMSADRPSDSESSREDSMQENEPTENIAIQNHVEEMSRKSGSDSESEPQQQIFEIDTAEIPSQAFDSKPSSLSIRMEPIGTVTSEESITLTETDDLDQAPPGTTASAVLDPSSSTNVNVATPDIPQVMSSTNSLTDINAESPKPDPSVEVPETDKIPDVQINEIAKHEICVKITPPDMDVVVPAPDISVQVPTPWEKEEVPTTDEQTEVQIPGTGSEVSTSQISAKVPKSPTDQVSPMPERSVEVSAADISVEVPTPEISTQVPTCQTDKEVPTSEISVEAIKPESSVQVCASPIIDEIATPEIDAEVSTPEISVQVPTSQTDEEVPTSERFVEAIKPEISVQVCASPTTDEIATPEIDAEVSTPGISVQVPTSLKGKVPKSDLTESVPTSDTSTPEISVKVPTPANDVPMPEPEISSVVPTPEVSVQVPASQTDDGPTPDISVEALKPEISVQVDASEPIEEIATPEKSAKVTTPDISVQVPTSQTGEEVPTPEVTVCVPKPDTSTPEIRMEVPELTNVVQVLEPDMGEKVSTPEGSVQVPSLEISSEVPTLDIKSQVSTPEVSIHIPTPQTGDNVPEPEIGAEIQTPEMSVNVPSVCVEVPSVESPTIEASEVHPTAATTKQDAGVLIVADAGTDTPSVNTEPEIDANICLDQKPGVIENVTEVQKQVLPALSATNTDVAGTGTSANLNGETAANVDGSGSLLQGNRDQLEGHLPDSQASLEAITSDTSSDSGLKKHAGIKTWSEIRTASEIEKQVGDSPSPDKGGDFIEKGPDLDKDSKINVVDMDPDNVTKHLKEEAAFSDASLTVLTDSGVKIQDMEENQNGSLEDAQEGLFYDDTTPNVDTAILRKAALMSVKMAEKKTQDRHRPKDKTATKSPVAVVEKVSSKEPAVPETVTVKKKAQPVEETPAGSSKKSTVGEEKSQDKTDKSKVTESLRKVQYWTRPTKVKMETMDADDKTDTAFASDFKKKMLMWNKKSEDTAPPIGNGTSKEDDRGTPPMAKEEAVLPKAKSQTLSSFPVKASTTTCNDTRGWVQAVAKPVTVRPAVNPGRGQAYQRFAGTGSQGTGVALKGRSASASEFDYRQSESQIIRNKSGEVSASTVFSSKPYRPGRHSGEFKLSVRPFSEMPSESLKEDKTDESTEASPVPPPRVKRGQSLGKVDIAVRPISSLYESLEDDKGEAKAVKEEGAVSKGEAKQSPRTPNQNVVLRRHFSERVQVSVRPVSMLLRDPSDDEEDSNPRRKSDITPRRSLSFTSPTSPVRSPVSPRLNVSIQPISAMIKQEREEKKKAREAARVEVTVQGPTSVTVSVTDVDGAGQEAPVKAEQTPTTATCPPVQGTESNTSTSTKPLETEDPQPKVPVLTGGGNKVDRSDEDSPRIQPDADVAVSKMTVTLDTPKSATDVSVLPVCDNSLTVISKQSGTKALNYVQRCSDNQRGQDHKGLERDHVVSRCQSDKGTPKPSVVLRKTLSDVPKVSRPVRKSNSIYGTIKLFQEKISSSDPTEGKPGPLKKTSSLSELTAPSDSITHVTESQEREESSRQKKEKFPKQDKEKSVSQEKEEAPREEREESPTIPSPAKSTPLEIDRPELKQGLKNIIQEIEDEIKGHDVKENETDVSTGKELEMKEVSVRASSPIAVDVEVSQNGMQADSDSPKEMEEGSEDSAKEKIEPVEDMPLKKTKPKIYSVIKSNLKSLQNGESRSPGVMEEPAVRVEVAQKSLSAPVSSSEDNSLKKSSQSVPAEVEVEEEVIVKSFRKLVECCPETWAKQDNVGPEFQKEMDEETQRQIEEMIIPHDADCVVNGDVSCSCREPPSDDDQAVLREPPSVNVHEFVTEYITFKSSFERDSGFCAPVAIWCPEEEFIRVPARETEIIADFKKRTSCVDFIFPLSLTKIVDTDISLEDNTDRTVIETDVEEYSVDEEVTMVTDAKNPSCSSSSSGSSSSDTSDTDSSSEPSSPNELSFDRSSEDGIPVSEPKFLIGREKDPSKSEVARLIQQSLEQDRRRDEVRKVEQDRLQDLHDRFQPRDEVLEQEHRRHSSESSSKGEEIVDLDESSEVEPEEEEEISDLLAGEATPMSMPSGVDTEESVSSPEEGTKPSIEVFDLKESSSEDVSPDMEPQALFVKLKEAQCKSAVNEAELVKLKARIIVLENSETQRKQYEKKCEEMAMRLRDMEKTLSSSRKEINHYQDMMEGSQGQYIALERKMKGEVTALEKKYHKAKKLIKEYQQREKDFIAERESLLQQQTEKDQQYNALVKSLKDRIFQLEGDLGEAQKAAGLPVLIPLQEASHRPELIQKTETTVVKSAPPTAVVTPRDSGSPVTSPSGPDTESVSSESDLSSSVEPVTSPEYEDGSSIKDEMVKPEQAEVFESMPQTQLLDTSANKTKGQLASAARRPPTKRPKSIEGEVDQVNGSQEVQQDESGLETWIKHDSDCSTVRKSDAKKRKAQLQGTETPPPGTETPPPDYMPPPPPPPTQQPPSLPDTESVSDTASNDRGESISGDSSSTVSQTSYDPSNPQFKNKHSEIPGFDTVSVDTAGTSETIESSSSAGTSNTGPVGKKSKGISFPKLLKFGSSGDRDKGGVVLVSSRSINKDDANGNDGGIRLLSSKSLNTNSDIDASSTISEGSSTYMVGEFEEEGKSSSYAFAGTPANEDHPSFPSRHNHNQIQSGAIATWNNEHVCHWLMGVDMEKYCPLFTEKSINGTMLLTLDGNRLKALGVASSKDREHLKKRIKDLKAALEKERKQHERERKQQEKELKAREKEQKKHAKKK